ncbi:MAG: F-type H+-transporting ATPase subunit delta [Frankiales bacterium]|jgi:F-type H+-transporting ATPase subunit delta|nr:F-type H+-transporting ATPase subunit delta [Frankiales bacterium]
MLGASRTALAEARTRLSGLGASPAELGTLSEELLAVVELLGRELPLRRTLADTAVEVDAKTALVTALLGDRVSAMTTQLLVEVVALRWSRPGDLVDGLEALGVTASFLQADGEGTLDRVEDELFRFERIVDSEADLRLALDDPNHDPAGKRRLLSALLGDKTTEATLRVIVAAAGARRRSFAEALTEFARLAADLRNRLNARVTAAVQPSQPQLDRLAQELSRLYGRQVGLRVEVDPQLLGGLVVRVGEEVIDASVVRRLDGARRQLADHV